MLLYIVPCLTAEHLTDLGSSSRPCITEITGSFPFVSLTSSLYEIHDDDIDLKFPEALCIIYFRLR